MEETSVWRAHAMEIPPLSERPVSQEEEEAFLRSIQPRRGLFGRRFIGPRRWRPGWGLARARRCWARRWAQRRGKPVR